MFEQKFKSNFQNEELENLKLSNDNTFKQKIIEKFEEMRNSRTMILGDSGSKEIEKRIFLQLIDQNWKTHIQYLEQLRQVIGLRSYGQRDPLIEYKKEAFNLFEDLLNKLKSQLIVLLINIKIVKNSEEQENKFKPSNTKKIGRNEICPCGSGKKYKNCCGAL